MIADLGMAKSLSEASGYTVTAGTPAYMAPEQALGQGFDQRADVYAVAAVTYTLLAGSPPFSGSGLVEIAERSRTGTPTPLGLDAAGAVDRELAAALSFDPALRPGSAGELAVRLDRLADQVSEVGAAETPTTRPAPTTRQNPAPATSPTPRPTAVEAGAPRARMEPRTPVTGVLVGAVALATVVAAATWLLLTVLG